MGRFVPPQDKLDFRELGQDRFQLLAPLWFESEVLKGLIVKAATGFIFDRESIPRWLPILYAWLAGTASRAGAIDDWITQTHKVGDRELTRRQGNAVYREAAQADGNGRAKRWAKWLGVTIGGRRSWANGPARFTLVGNERRKNRRDGGTR
mgnify:CR=1 FL=1